MIRMIVIGMVSILGMNLSVIAQGTTTHASTSLFDVLPTDQKGIFRVNYQGIHGDITVDVYDQQGNNILHKEYPKTHQFSQLYNFETAPEGKYTFVAMTPLGKDEEVIYFDGISLPELEVVSTEDPSKLRLIMKNYDGRPVTLVLKDENLNSVHTQTVNAVGKVEQVFNVSQLPGKEVTFVVFNELGQTKSETYRFE